MDPIHGDGDTGAFLLQESDLRDASNHKQRFLFLAHGPDGLIGLHVVTWLPGRQRRVAKSGINGWVQAEASFHDVLDMSKVGPRRIHLCRQHPCEAAAWHPSKHGDHEPPARHGRCIKLLGNS